PHTSRNSTPTETITDASSVPIDTRLPASRTVSSEATKATAIPVTIEVMYGVWNLGCTLFTNCGSKPSRDIEENTRDWPSSITRLADTTPAIPPSMQGA